LQNLFPERSQILPWHFLQVDWSGLDICPKYRERAEGCGL
jgi:hypothetical protein